eukprot:CAMPEP_0176449000 /NCGR_PEP_ID=MMETSP0127-20121128/26177_1 /TAXON_ID=938130 /ORGANISM="Platyophrya macrostoma, Strain WH" /LENGTH=65 /DNA_ID=CAMNT_0017836175 /DNA_START=164 /DNA_END=361 /DNA_ORIENTATION=+
MAEEFSSDPCVKKVSTELQLKAVECLMGWKSERNLMKTIDCGSSAITKTTDKLKSECKVDFKSFN